MHQKFYCFTSPHRSFPLTTHLLRAHCASFSSEERGRGDRGYVRSNDCKTRISIRALKRVVNLRLGASFHACNIVTHWVNASLGWVDLHNHLQLLFAACQLFFPEGAERFALFHHKRLWVFAFLEHLVDVIRFLVQMWLEPWLVHHPSWRKPACYSSSHWVFSFSKMIIIYLSL